MKRFNANLVNGLCMILFILCFSLGSYLGLGVAHAKNPPAKKHIDELMDAANMGQIAKVKSLISSGVDVNAISKQGWTALTVATFDNRDEVTKYLIESGADVNLVGAYGTTALMNAASNANLAMVKLLLAKGADAKFQGAGLSVLMVAASAGNVEIVKLLLDKGADVNIKNKEDGKTALFYAAHQGHMDIIKLLLKHGADVNAVDNEGQNVLEYAYMGNKKEALSFLKEQGAKLPPKIEMREMELNKPLVGKTDKFKPQAADIFIVNFPLNDAILERQNDNFVMSFADGASIELIDFYKVFSEKNVPKFVIEGQVIPVDVIFSTLSHELSLDK